MTERIERELLAITRQGTIDAAIVFVRSHACQMKKQGTELVANRVLKLRIEVIPKSLWKRDLRSGEVSQTAIRQAASRVHPRACFPRCHLRCDREARTSPPSRRDRSFSAISSSTPTGRRPPRVALDGEDRLASVFCQQLEDQLIALRRQTATTETMGPIADGDDRASIYVRYSITRELTPYTQETTP